MGREKFDNIPEGLMRAGFKKINKILNLDYGTTA
jgi:hypothetical protein